MEVGRPSSALSLLLWLYRSGRFTRGYGRLIDALPDRLWGGPALLIPTDAGEMALPLRDHGSRAILVFGALHPELRCENDFVKGLFEACDFVIDIGANVGWYTCLARSAMGDRGRICALEANRDAYRFLQVNGRLRGGITAYNIVVAENAGTVDFYCAANSVLSSAAVNVGDRIRARSTALDDMWRQEWGRRDVDLVKCDVEGGELEVLCGSRALRDSEHPPIWMLEVEEDLLAGTGREPRRLDEELALTGHTVRLFYLNQGCVVVEAESIEALVRVGDRLTANVFVVPGPRVPMFLRCTERWSSPAAA
jgi:FkbM family methyltransferase